MNQHFAALAFSSPVPIQQFVDTSEISHTQRRTVESVVLDLVAILQLVKTSHV